MNPGDFLACLLACPAAGEHVHHPSPTEVEIEPIIVALVVPSNPNLEAFELNLISFCTSPYSSSTVFASLFPSPFWMISYNGIKW